MAVVAGGPPSAKTALFDTRSGLSEIEVAWGEALPTAKS
jgi:hypothetical protein